ncbi:transposase [Amphibacillus sp. MSJ-3]|nr:transposase [Amphibacillus sp. MSJ-3]
MGQLDVATGRGGFSLTFLIAPLLFAIKIFGLVGLGLGLRLLAPPETFAVTRPIEDRLVFPLESPPDLPITGWALLIMDHKKKHKEKTGETYGQGKIDVEPFFGFLKANLGFARLFLRDKSKVDNELGFVLLAVNLRKLATNNSKTPKHSNHYKIENGSIYKKTVIRTIFLF